MTTESFDEFNREIKKIADALMQGIENAAQDIADYILFESQKNLTEGDFSPAKGKGAVNRGALLRSGKVKSDEKFVKYVSYDIPYATHIEYGMKPTKVSDDDLIEWVWDKKAVFNIRHKKEAEVVGKAIAKNIREKGTIPRPFLRRALASLTLSKIASIINDNMAYIRI